MYNNINTNYNNPTLTCGIVIKYDNCYLMVKPSYDSTNLISIPKGIISNDKTELDCALRETIEETGVDLIRYKNHITHIGYYNYKHGRKMLSAFYIDITDICKFDNVLDTQFKSKDFRCDSYTEDTNEPENSEILLMPISLLLMSDNVHYTQRFLFNDINGIE